MRWNPQPFWRGEDVYIIGGGTSLERFDMSLLKHRHTIGCNVAFLEGQEICDICFFGDIKWWELFKPQLIRFEGMVVTNAPALYSCDVSWLMTMKRVSKGLALDALGWNCNSGAAAINLALILGAKRVFLLGFDMKLGEDGRPNYHNHRVEKETPEVYQKFLVGFKDVARDLLIKFPDREIINVNDDSELKLFPMVSVEEHFREAS